MAMGGTPLSVILALSERVRHKTQERFDSVHDLEHSEGQLPKAAICYIDAALSLSDKLNIRSSSTQLPTIWPWDEKWWKPTDNTIRNLIKGISLLLAEVDRRVYLGESFEFKTINGHRRTSTMDSILENGGMKWLSLTPDTKEDSNDSPST